MYKHLKFLLILLFISCITNAQVSNFNPIIVNDKLKGYLLITKFNTTKETNNFVATIYDEDLQLISNVSASKPEAMFIKSIDFFEDYFIYHFISVDGKDYISFKYDGTPINYTTLKSYEFFDNTFIRSNSRTIVDNNLLSKSLENGLLLEQSKPTKTSNEFEISLRDSKKVLWVEKIENINSSDNSTPIFLNYVHENEGAYYLFSKQNKAYNSSYALFQLGNRDEKQLLISNFTPVENWKDVTILKDQSKLENDTLLFFYEESLKSSNKQPWLFGAVKTNIKNGEFENKSYPYFQKTKSNKTAHEAYIIDKNLKDELPNVVFFVLTEDDFGLIINEYDLFRVDTPKYYYHGVDQVVILNPGNKEGIKYFATKNIDGSNTYLLHKKIGKKNHLYTISTKNKVVIYKKYIITEKESAEYYPSNNPYTALEVVFDKKLKAYKFKRIIFNL